MNKSWLEQNHETWTHQQQITQTNLEKSQQEHEDYIYTRTYD